MMNKPPIIDNENDASRIMAVSDLLKDLQIEIKTNRAIDFAYKGEYGLADSLFNEIVRDYGETSFLLDLQARSYVQQGRLKEAEILLNKANLLNPNNLKYLAALKRVRNLNKLFGTVPFTLRSQSIAAIAMSIIILIFTIFVSFKPLNLQINSKKVQTSQTLQSNNPKQIDSASTEIDKLQRLISSIPGIVSKIDKGDLVVIFEHGLFSNGTKLNESSEIALDSLCNSLGSRSNYQDIIIYGCTDNIPMMKAQKYKDNLSLGKARAEKVYITLTKKTSIPAEKILTCSYGELLPAFLDENALQDMRQRTVFLKIRIND
ncbi:MAG: OmpA family protein [Candidatus Cloacimonas sp.]|jgi:flagellar motor protein MotB|nr:OmpA family protein [Candidatus Cloacimonas sp.]